MNPQYDIDKGHLIKSPCLGCPSYDMPECIEGCARLHEVQVFLAGSISTHQSRPDDEDYRVVV